MELPSNYLEEMKELLGDQYEAYLASFEQKTRQGLRVNTAKIAPETFRQKADISLECVPWCENGFAFDEKQTVTKHPYYYAGLYYVQEPSAMIPASHLPVSRAILCWISVRLRAAKPRNWGQNCLGKDFWWQMTSVLRG